MSNSILFLDLASRFGWCEGVPGEKPIFGSERFAPEGSPDAAVSAGAIKWVGTRLQAFKPRTIVYEAPLLPMGKQGKTNIKTIRRLIGLPFAVEGVAYLSGVWDVREARVDDVRMFLLGSRPKKDVAKRMVIEKLRALGYDVTDNDAADALAGWLYACSLIAPGKAPEVTPLFEPRKEKPSEPMWERF